MRWSKKARGFFVENLFTVDCEELDDLTAVLEEGLRNRSVGRHNMNDFSRFVMDNTYIYYACYSASLSISFLTEERIDFVLFPR